MPRSSPPPPDQLNLGDLARNDLRGVRAYYKQRGTLTADEWRVLRGLQDNPKEFERLSRRWSVTPTGGHALDNT